MLSLQPHFLKIVYADLRRLRIFHRPIVCRLRQRDLRVVILLSRNVAAATLRAAHGYHEAKVPNAAEFDDKPSIQMPAIRIGWLSAQTAHALLHEWRASPGEACCAPEEAKINFGIFVPSETGLLMLCDWPCGVHDNCGHRPQEPAEKPCKGDEPPNFSYSSLRRTRSGNAYIRRNPQSVLSSREGKVFTIPLNLSRIHPPPSH